MKTTTRLQLSDFANMASILVFKYEKEVAIKIREEEYGLTYKLEVDLKDGKVVYRISIIFGITYPIVRDATEWCLNFEEACNNLKEEFRENE